jgi:NTF2 fold immunity protein
MRILYILAFALFAGSAHAQGTAKHSYVPPRGFVPDSTTAVRIAGAVWISIYGEETIADERPFIAKLRNGVWTVHGSLPRGNIGGVAEAEISKRSGRIIRVSHGK